MPPKLIPSLTFWSVTEHSLADIWRHSPAFNTFRGTDWMAEPCRSCPKQREDFGGCRCQAFLLTGDAYATDPVCHLSPLHDEMERIAAIQDEAYEYRRLSTRAGCHTLIASGVQMSDTGIESRDSMTALSQGG